MGKQDNNRKHPRSSGLQINQSYYPSYIGQSAFWSWGNVQGTQKFQSNINTSTNSKTKPGSQEPTQLNPKAQSFKPEL